MTPYCDSSDSTLLDSLIDELTTSRADMVRLEEHLRDELSLLQPSWQRSARNLLHYVALRRRDVRGLQQKLAMLGLSSLGRSEAHVMANIDNVLGLLHRLTGQTYTPPVTEHPAVNFEEGKRLLDTHTTALFGLNPSQRHVRIMVTVPTEAATDFKLVRDLVTAGMDSMRINCAHDSREDWEQMAANLRRAEHETGRKCRIVMDIAGPKLQS